LAAILSITIGILLGILWGVIEGYVISYLGIPAFIVTLGGLFIMRGAILIRTEGRTIPANQPYLETIAQGYLPKDVSWIIAGIVIVFLFYNMFRSRRKKREYGFELSSLAMDLSMTFFFSVLVSLYVNVVNKYQGIQLPVMLLLIAAAVLAYVSNNTRFGRYAYAIGGNREAARLSGINIRKNVFQVFVLMGFLCGIGGVVLASYVGYGTIAAGEGYELDAIAAAILGGTSPLGGEGTIVGALFGALIMSSLTNGLQIMNVAPGWTQLVKGFVLVLAVYADARLKRNR
jgi:D-xylose transport system permease protein